MSFPDLQRATETHPPPERASQKDREGGEGDRDREREREGRGAGEGGGKEAHEMGWRKRRTLELKGGREDMIVCACM